MTFDQRRVSVVEPCASCHGAVELACEGLSGYLGYRTYNEHFCPYCHKMNRALTSGAIVSARATHALAKPDA